MQAKTMRLDESFMLIMKTYLSIVETKGYLYWHEGFYKMTFDYSTIKKRLRDSQSPVYALYDIQFAIPESGNDLEKIVRDIESAPEIIEELSKKGVTDHIEYEVKAFFHRVFTRSGMNPTRVAEIVKNYCKEKLGYLTQDDTGRTSSFFVLKEKVRIIRISSVAGANGFIRVIDKLIDEKLKSNGLNKDADQGTQLFYRGHGDLNYILEPSLFRRPGLAEHESELCFEIISRRLNDFEHNKTHLETLSKIQHFAGCTRLLDFTTNPLVALYFACENKEGEVIVLAPGTNRIKNAYSDTITILSSLHRFTAEEKEELYKLVEDVDIKLYGKPEWNADNEEIDEGFNRIKIIQRLLHVIKYEKPSFTDRLKKSSLVQDLIVHPFKDNPRIIRQDGVFAIKSLSKYNGIDNMRIKDKDDNTVIFHISQTHKILKELNLMGINRASLFPDIENIARHFKSIYESVL